MMIETRKPATGKVAGLLNIEVQDSKSDRQEDSPNPRELQAAHLCGRWPALSLPLARAVAELAYGRMA